MHIRASAPDWLNAVEIARVRLGFARVVPNCGAFADDFHARLFELAPTTSALFPDGVSNRRAKFRQTLVMLMTSLSTPTELKPALAALGNRCRACGVVEADFAAISQALIGTLAAHLGTKLTIADFDAWTALHGRIAGLLTAGTALAAAAA